MFCPVINFIYVVFGRRWSSVALRGESARYGQLFQRSFRKFASVVIPVINQITLFQMQMLILTGFPIIDKLISCVFPLFSNLVVLMCHGAREASLGFSLHGGDGWYGHVCRRTCKRRHEESCGINSRQFDILSGVPDSC